MAFSGLMLKWTHIVKEADRILDSSASEAFPQTKPQLNYQPFILGIVQRIGLFASDTGSYFSSNTRANLSSRS